MSRATFTWFPEFESQLSQEPNITVTKFGDGYESRTPMGINNSPEKWSLKFSETNSVFSEVLGFVRARNGVESFYWRNPFGAINVYVCRKWSMTRSQGYSSINLDFEQVFEA